MQVLQELASGDPNFAARIRLDTDSRVKSVIWCSGKNRTDYAYFGDVVTFDTTYRTNLYNMPFGLFVGVNEHFQSTIFGGVLLRDEKIQSFEWAFSTFVDIMNGKRPDTMLTDQCQAMEAAIKYSLPSTRHRWCKWHVLRVAKEKIGHVYSKQSGFKKEFHDLVINETCPSIFESRSNEIIGKYRLGSNSYLKRIYDRREMWAKPYFMWTFCAGSTQRSERANHLLKRYIPRSSPMHIFVRQYNNMLDSRLADEQEQLHACKQKRRMLKHGVPLEVHAAVVYTKAMYDRFSDDLFKSGAYMVSEMDAGLLYKVKMMPSFAYSSYDLVEHTVRIAGDSRSIWCDCGVYEHVGMLCSHSLKER
ncbi:protein FAR1-RELATED SEQUENCE 5-like isoform X2 [Brachypodium distachyon]|uniref:protein FAR1-RELATED SEQUENCE 5-like isoform X2 n=1 Tax=Brachypodium distachyon TaxID=15368 RepID=UPI000D0CEB5E|nr:protein FAR1-RELATED SEQUENCE 5-like isoform X2 [Brachypodium distachyon]|eukprot:XP_024310904.1 protein FAR1-RELATED SEQUENCE 5-like isoform X2 [Brachypodium distachyon]